MSALPYMPLYWGDFFSKVAHLSGFTQAIYVVLLGRLWLAGGALPDDDKRIAEMLSLKVATWRRLKPELIPFLQLGDGWIRQARVTEDLARAHEGIRKRVLRTTRAREELAKKRKTKGLGKPNGSVTAAVTAGISEPDIDTSPIGAVSGSPLAPNGTSPEEDHSVARDLGLTPSRSPPASPRNGWDQPPSPGPSNPTAFQQWLEAGNPPLPGPPPLQPTRHDEQQLWDKVNERMKPTKPLPGTIKPKEE